jgi:Antibiotic biosynthesis monooxygenase.
MERVAIIAYKPNPGKEQALRALIKKHSPCLRQAGLITDKEAFVLETKDGTIVEVFEWKSEHAMKTAHKHPQVQQMWCDYAEVSTYTPLNRLQEAGKLFADFATVN